MGLIARKDKELSNSSTYIKDIVADVALWTDAMCDWFDANALRLNSPQEKRHLWLSMCSLYQRMRVTREDYINIEDKIRRSWRSRLMGLQEPRKVLGSVALRYIEGTRDKDIRRYISRKCKEDLIRTFRAAVEVSMTKWADGFPTASLWNNFQLKVKTFDPIDTSMREVFRETCVLVPIAEVQAFPHGRISRTQEPCMQAGLWVKVPYTEVVYGCGS